MELRVLQYFLVVVREENISRAAEVLHITQPTLSRQITQLEQELGVQLFIRGRHLALTDAGVMLHRRAEEIITLMDKIEKEFQGQSDIGGIISIGTGGLSAFHTLPSIMGSFRQRYPNVQFQLYTNSAEYIKERIEQGLLDFGLLLEPVDISKYDYIRMKEKERWGLLMKSDDPLASKSYITSEDLLEISIIVSDRLPLQKEFENWLGYKISELDIFGKYNITTNLITFISKGIAYVLTIEGSVEALDKRQFIFKPLYPEFSTTSVLAWKKLQPSSRAARKFLEYFKSMQ